MKTKVVSIKSFKKSLNNFVNKRIIECLPQLLNRKSLCDVEGLYPYILHEDIINLLPILTKKVYNSYACNPYRRRSEHCRYSQSGISFYLGFTRKSDTILQIHFKYRNDQYNMVRKKKVFVLNINTFK